MNIVFFASDSKGVSVLKNVVLAAKEMGHDYVAMFSDENQLQYPLNPQTRDNFYIDCSIDITGEETLFSESLGLPLPFKPDALVIQRERWQPEQSIIEEFKRKFDAKVVVVEVNSLTVNGPEARLEMISRAKYPQAMVDLYCEHSDFTKERRLACLDDIPTPDGKSWDEKIVVTGNPRYMTDFDNNLDEWERLATKYGLDESNKQTILFWGVQNSYRPKAFQAIESLMKNIDTDKYDVLYKCYPGERDAFPLDFHPEFKVPGVKVVYDNTDTDFVSDWSDVHICLLSSATYYPLYYRRKVVLLNEYVGSTDDIVDLTKYTVGGQLGIEDSARFWMRVHGFRSVDEFIEAVGPKRLELFGEQNKEVFSIANESCYQFTDDLSFLSDYSKEFYAYKLFNAFASETDRDAALNVIQQIEKLL